MTFSFFILFQLMPNDTADFHNLKSKFLTQHQLQQFRLMTISILINLVLFCEMNYNDILLNVVLSFRNDNDECTAAHS